MSDQSIHGVVMVAMEDWHGVWRRFQPVSVELARRRPHEPLLYVGRHHDVSHGIRRLSLRPVWRALRKPLYEKVDAYDNIYTMKPTKWLPNTIGWCRWLNRWHERRQIRRAMKKLGIRRPLLFMNPYYAVHMPGRMGEAISVYDVGDDWTKAPQKPWELERTIAEDDQQARQVDLTIVVSQALYDLMKPKNENTHLIPNGVFVDRYEGVAEHTIQPHAMCRDWPKPVLGYTGTLHSTRIDVELLIRVADAYPQATLVLVGPDHLYEEDRRKLEKAPNIRIYGPVDFEEVPRLMAGFDIMIVPHRVNEFTESLSPLKYYEALAAGLPVASTPVTHFRDRPDLFCIGSRDNGYIDAISDSLKDTSKRIRARRDTASNYDWKSRVDDIVLAIDVTLNKTHTIDNL